MRNCGMLAIFALAALVTVPEAADARSRFSSRSILGVATAPFRTVMRAVPGLSGSRFQQRRAAAARAYAPQATREAARTAGVGTASVDRARVEDTAEPSRAQPLARAPAAFNAYEDILGYALWPDDYAGQFFARGYGDVMKAVVSPSAATASASAADDRPRRGRKHLARASDADREMTSSVAATGMCGSQVEAQAGKTLDRVSQVIELTEAQRASLQALRAALTEAIARGKAACLDALPTTPGGRLKTAADALWVMRDTDILFRTPLVNFYASLSDAQKAQLNGAKPPADNAADKDSTKPAEVRCGAGDNDLPINAIEQSVRPTPEQRGGLEMLRGLSGEMAGYLAASCPQATPPDPVARLDAVGNRVSAMLYAVMLFDQGLSGFYLQLDDTQKKRFETLSR
jgi:hypothetical protein